MRLVLLSSILAAYASAQIPQPRIHDMLIAAQPAPTSAATYDDTYPTNIPGYAAYSRYIAEGNWYTASGSAAWTNMVIGSSAGDATNKTAGTSAQPIYTPNAVNGFAALSFSNNAYLRSDSYSVVQQPHEVFMVIVLTNNAGASRHFINATNATTKNQIRQNTGSSLEMSAGSPITPLGTGVQITNQFFVLNAIFNGANSTIYTNGVQGTVGNANTAAVTGLMLGADQAMNNRFAGMMAEVITFATNLGAINSAGDHCVGVRSNVTYTLMTKYAIQ